MAVRIRLADSIVMLYFDWKSKKIKKKLEKLGYECFYSSLYGPSFFRTILDEEGREKYRQRVDIIRSKIGGVVRIQSYISGQDCPYGYSCSYPVDYDAMRLFVNLEKLLRHRWFFEDFFVKRREKRRGNS